MEAWIPITIAAAFAQNLRFMLQKHLKATQLSTTGATFARFLYSAPVIAVVVATYLQASDQALPAMGTRFWGFALSGGLAQILATMCVVSLFATRNFAVGVSFAKTEVLFTVLTGMVLLSERVSAAGLGAIMTGFVGVILLSDPPSGQGRWYRRILNRAAGLGLLSGVLFSISAVCYRGASLSLPSDDVFLRAALTLSAVTAAQCLAMLVWLRWREPGQVGKVLAAWRVAGPMGLLSLAGSLCWFTAFTLQTAAYVKALGQIELLFNLAGSYLVFRERITARELLALAFLTGSIVLLILVL